MPFTFPFSFFNFHFSVSLTVPGTSFQGIQVFFKKSKFMIITFLNLPHWKLNYIEIETEKIRGHCALFKAPNVYSEHVINIHLISLSNPLHAKKKNIYIYTVLSRCTLANQETQSFESDQKYISLVKLWPLKSQ